MESQEIIWSPRSCDLDCLQFKEWKNMSNVKHKSDFWRGYDFNALLLFFHFFQSPWLPLMRVLLTLWNKLTYIRAKVDDVLFTPSLIL